MKHNRLQARCATGRLGARTLLSGPSPIGAASQSRSQGHGPVREKPSGTGTTGGVWFAPNGPDVWALASADPALAYREYKTSTRGAYAHACPDNWFGVLSGPDSYDSFESSSAGQPSIPMYPVQDSLPPAWELFDTTAEAGIEAGASGYTIDPHWPFPGFRWDTSVVGVSYGRAAHPGTCVRPAAARSACASAYPPAPAPARCSGSDRKPGRSRSRSAPCSGPCSSPARRSSHGRCQPASARRLMIRKGAGRGRTDEPSG